VTERGSLLVSAAFLAAVAGLSAAALDVSNWYRTNRKLQSGTDGAALAGAQALPDNPAAARKLAGGGKVTVSTTVIPNDTITVRRKQQAPGFLSSMLSGSRSVEATASARVGDLNRVRFAAPIAADAGHPLLADSGCPCWNRTTTLDVRLLDLGGMRPETGTATIAAWIRRGFDGYLSRGWYRGRPTAKGAAPELRTALSERVGSDLLIPIYRQSRPARDGVEYRVVGWAGFHLTGSDLRGTKTRLYGWFERVIWEGTPSENRSENDFGVRTIALID
jgi:Putative Flp pilus-assembly TadE/G-like